MLKTQTSEKELAFKLGLASNIPEFRKILTGEKQEDESRIQGIFEFLEDQRKKQKEEMKLKEAKLDKARKAGL